MRITPQFNFQCLEFDGKRQQFISQFVVFPDKAVVYAIVTAFGDNTTVYQITPPGKAIVQFIASASERTTVYFVAKCLEDKAGVYLVAIAFS